MIYQKTPKLAVFDLIKKNKKFVTFLYFYKNK